MTAPNTHLTVLPSGAESVGATADEPGHYPALEDSTAESVVVAGAFATSAEVRAAYRAQFGRPCPV